MLLTVRKGAIRNDRLSSTLNTRSLKKGIVSDRYDSNDGPMAVLRSLSFAKMSVMGAVNC